MIRYRLWQWMLSASLVPSLLSRKLPLGQAYSVIKDSLVALFLLVVVSHCVNANLPCCLCDQCQRFRDVKFGKWVGWGWVWRGGCRGVSGGYALGRFCLGKSADKELSDARQWDAMEDSEKTRRFGIFTEMFQLMPKLLWDQKKVNRTEEINYSD